MAAKKIRVGFTSIKRKHSWASEYAWLAQAMPGLCTHDAVQMGLEVIELQHLDRLDAERELHETPLIENADKAFVERMRRNHSGIRRGVRSQDGTLDAKVEFESCFSYIAARVQGVRSKELHLRYTGLLDLRGVDQAVRQVLAAVKAAACAA